MHVTEWTDCDRCYLEEGRKRTVLGRGKLPCDILFVGEAPGKSEDTSGVAFDGPAGILLDRIVRLSGADRYRLAFNNLLACIPLDETGNKVARPPDKCVRECSPRLGDFISMARPRLIVCVGEVAERWLTPGHRHAIDIGNGDTEWDGVHPLLATITHPGRILRTEEVKRPLMVQKAVAYLEDAVAELEEAMEKDRKARGGSSGKGKTKGGRR